MTQVTSVNLDELTIIDLYKHHAAMEHSLPLLTDESRPMLQAELEACLNRRSEKVDRLYYVMSSYERDLEQVKKEKKILMAAQKHAESQIKQCKQLLVYLRTFLPKDTNHITGKNYQFTIVRNPKLTIEIKSDPLLWSAEDQFKFCVIQEVTTSKRTVLRSMEGTIIDDDESSKTVTTTIPNLDAIEFAYQSGQPLPEGVRVRHQYSVRTKRIFNEKLDLQTSESAGYFLPKD